MKAIVGLRTLVKVKERRVGQLDDALRASRQHAQQQRAALEQAGSHEAACRDEEQGLRDGLHATTTTTGGLRGSDIMARQLQLDDAVHRTAAATKAVHQAQQQEEAARQQVQAAQQALQRGQQRLDKTKERLAGALRDREQAQEDVQDEEAEETAVARMVAQARERAAMQEAP